jgi:hypothetical protein
MKPTKQEFFGKIASNFTSHVRQSIPLYGKYFDKLSRFVAEKHTNSSILDICGSRGDLGLYIRDSGFRGMYLNLDGSKEMIAESVLQNQHIYDRSIMAGWLSSWTENDYFVREWRSNERFDVIVENLAFQFMGSPLRYKHILEVKKKIRNKGLFITCEKFMNPYWSENENLKDLLWKSKYFTQEEIEQKRETVLTDMNKDLCNQAVYEDILRDNFEYVAKIYVAGNFAAYVCSDDEYKVLECADYFRNDLELMFNIYTKQN